MPQAGQTIQLASEASLTRNVQTHTTQILPNSFNKITQEHIADSINAKLFALLEKL